MSALDGAGFWSYFENFQHTAWRLETQPTYTIPSEQANIARFLAGEPKPADHNHEWHDQIRAWATVGKTLGRVRVVSQPLTDYQRYQLAWGIPGNVEAGEDTRILDTSEHPNLGLPQQDFWMFDDKTVVHINFRPDGTVIGHELIDDPDMDQYLSWQRVALGHAVPVREWNART